MGGKNKRFSNIYAFLRQPLKPRRKRGRKSNWREKTQKEGDGANPREWKEMEHEGMKEVYRERKGGRKQDTGREMRCRRNGRLNGETQEEEKGRICSGGG